MLKERILQFGDKVINSLTWRRMLTWLPDKAFLKLRFFFYMGHRLNLHNPKTFNEKLQWLKLYDRNPAYTQMVDKYNVKKYVADKMGEEYVIPILGGPWKNFDDIEFDKLPEKFVLKCSHDCGSIIVCRDKSQLDVKAAKRKLEKALTLNYFYMGREWPYKNVKPQIFAEKYMSDKKNVDELTDYKFYCFHGEPKYLYVAKGSENHETMRISFLNLDWGFADFGRSDYLSLEELPTKPDSYDEMLEVARVLSEGIPFVRVDLYEIEGRIYFGELTFSPCGGMMLFDPLEADKEVGSLLNLSDIMARNLVERM